MAQYGKSDYWNDRYSRDIAPFDWYQRWDTLGGIFKNYVKTSDRILVVGCGSSRLSEDMFHDGFTNITNIDISPAVIQGMKQKHSDHPLGNSYKLLDVSQMSEFLPASFDVVIDKATLDSILCGEGSVSNCDKSCNEISRVLKPGGFYLLVSHGDPDSRRHYLDKSKFGWKINTLTLDKPRVSALPTNKDTSELHYIYVITKL